MGKDSLLESTSKKKAAAKADKEKPAKKKTAAKKSTGTKTTGKGKTSVKAKKTAAAKTKKTAAKTTAKKTAVKAAPKKAAQKKTAAAKTTAQKAAPKAAPKKAAPRKPTRKELLWKKFDFYPADQRFRPPVQAAATAESPSFFAGMSEADAKAAKTYLHRTFVWADIKAAGEAYAARLEAKAIEDAKRKAEEEAKRKAEEDAKRKAEEDAKRRAEEDAKRKAEEDAKRRAEEEAKRKAEEDAKRKAEEEAKRRAEEDAKRKAEEDAKRRAEEDAKRKAEEDAKRRAEEDAKRKAAEQLPPPPAGTETRTKGGFSPFKIGLIGFCAIILILIVSSHSNTKHYYIEEKDGAVEIWRGIFAPMGKSRLMILPGIQMPQETKEVYGWQEAYRLMYQYYIEMADAILEVPGVPDIAALTSNLEKAIRYAPNRELRDAARSRLVSLRMQTQVQKAQAALNRGTIESAAKAIAFLEDAAQLDLSPAEAEMIERQIAAAETVRSEREMARAEAEKAAAQEAALAQEAQTLQEAAANQPPAAEEGQP